jgi:hypothetical protein
MERSTCNLHRRTRRRARLSRLLSGVALFRKSYITPVSVRPEQHVSEIEHFEEAHAPAQ